MYCSIIIFLILINLLFFCFCFSPSTDYRHVPVTESGNVHREILASGNWIFAHIRRTHVENLEVNLFARFLLIFVATRSFENNSSREVFAVFRRTNKQPFNSAFMYVRVTSYSFCFCSRRPRPVRYSLPPPPPLQLGEP